MATGALRLTAVQPALDVGVAVALAVLTLAQLLSTPTTGNPTLLTVFALAAVLPVAARRRHPAPVTAIVGIGVVGQAAVTGGAAPSFASFVAAMICVYTLARYAGRVQLAAGLVVLAAAVVAGGVLQARAEPFSPFELVYPLVYFGLAGGLGAIVRQRALRLTAVQDRASALEGALERETELAAAEERTRIARELHDVVAHGLSLMVVQAEAAEELLDRSPAAAVTPIQRVQTTGRQALDEMRRLLGVLRVDGAPTGTAPQPGLHRLPELAREAADLGLAVDLRCTGELADLPPGLQLTGYRIVQEALTNTRRHAAARTARVEVTRTDDALRLEITDDGRGPAGAPPGHGLIGMRERAALYGGTLHTGDAPDGGFRVLAVLPTGEPAR
jgi:signal transduction histidine kinase